MTEQTIATEDMDKKITPPQATAPLDDFGSDFNFDDLVEGGEETVAALHAELKTTEFGSLDVKDFTEFSASDYTPTEGEYVFSIEQKWLREATSVMRLVSQVSSRGCSNGTKVTVFKDKVRLATFNQAAFSEIFVPTFSKQFALEKEISFVFDLGVLSKIASSFGDAIIEFKFLAKAGLLEIASGNTRLELSTVPSEDFVDYHSKISNPEMLATLDPLAFKSGLSYIIPFVQKDEVSANLSLIDVRNGVMIGGAHTAIGLYQHKSLEDLNFKVKFEVMGTLEKLMSRFHQTNTHLFNAGAFYIIRDENLYLGFEKSQFDFPAIHTYQNAVMKESILVQRSDLVSSLNKLSVVSVDRKMLVRLDISGVGKDVQFKLTTTDAAGRESSDKLSGFRQAEGGGSASQLQPQACYVTLQSLLRVCSHFETANVNIKFDESGSTRVLYLEDTDEDLYAARTIITLLTPEAVREQMAQQKMSTLEKVQGAKSGAKKPKTEASEEEAV